MLCNEGFLESLWDSLLITVCAWVLEEREVIPGASKDLCVETPTCNTVKLFLYSLSHGFVHNMTENNKVPAMLVKHC